MTQTGTGTERSDRSKGGTEIGGSDKVGQIRARYGIIVVLIGVAGLVGGLVAVLYWSADTTGGTLLGIITSPIAAIVASYFGISAARQASEEAGAAKERAGLTQLDKAQSLGDARSKFEDVVRLAQDNPAEAARIAREGAEAAAESAKRVPDNT